MREAIEVASRSKDENTKVGALLVAKDDFATIATGYNGFIRGADDAKLPKSRPDPNAPKDEPTKYDYMRHAEENIITHCARRGIATKDTFIVITLSPCTNCLRMCYQAGIDEFYFLEEYRDFHKSANMLDLNVQVKQICTNQYTLSKITLTPKK
tara:strand:+ start:64904 stop:65365 length:462 start_codon:yes stop_codon:yes gene_type:complete